MLDPILHPPLVTVPSASPEVTFSPLKKSSVVSNIITSLALCFLNTEVSFQIPDPLNSSCTFFGDPIEEPKANILISPSTTLSSGLYV